METESRPASGSSSCVCLFVSSTSLDSVSARWQVWCTRSCLCDLLISCSVLLVFARTSLVVVSCGLSMSPLAVCGEAWCLGDRFVRFDASNLSASVDLITAKLAHCARSDWHVMAA